MAVKRISKYTPGEPITMVLGISPYKFIGYVGDTISSGGSLSIELSLLSGEKFNLSTLNLSCAFSIIQDWYITLDGSRYYRGYFDMETFKNFPESGAYVFLSGQTLGVTVINNDVSSRRMYISLSGSYE